MNERHDLDVITIGRAGVDLYGQQIGARLEDVHSFAKYLGGCPANIAVGTARLGLRSAIITRVGDDHLGRFLLEQFVREGVDTDGITTDPERLTAMVVLGIRDRETFPLVFYRENCADMALTPADIDENFIARSRSVLFTGTHFSTEDTRAACSVVLEAAQKHGCKIILDIDYRPVLWGLTSRSMGEERFVSAPAVTQTLQSFAPFCDLIVGTEEELHILGGTTDTLAAVRAIRAISAATIVCKLGEQGCVVFDGAIPEQLNMGIAGEGFPIEVFNVLGAGDAFMSGFLLGWLSEHPLAECCRLANACGALVVSRHGCAPAIPTREELDWYLKQGSSHRALRKDAQLERLHWATTRQKRHRDLAIFAIDHRSQLEELAANCDVPESRISELKNLAVKAVESISDVDMDIGILLDGRHGTEALFQMAGTPYWTGRAIELPGSRPLDFDTEKTVGGEMLEWDKAQVAKCLCFYHPDDPSDLRVAQERRVLDAYKASRESGREFLLEIISSKHGPVTSSTVSDVMDRMYEIGVYPDWWKLEPAIDADTWKNISSVIERNDPHCHGILILGLAGNADDIVDCFHTTTDYPRIKGFAVGRTIFQSPAQDWLMGQIDDEEVILQLKQNFEFLINGWRSTRVAKAEESVG